MPSLALALVFAVFIWWFSTGLVLLLNRLPRRARRWSLFASTGLAVAALVGLEHTAWRTGAADAYCAFTCALLVWGWHELTFLSGWITGPRKTALRVGATHGHRFVEAVRAILWHELAIVAVGSLIIFMTWGAPNQVGTGTFLVLWVMRTSAKLNLFFGVRNLNEEFLPKHLAYMESFFRRRAVNLFFPFAVAAASAALTLLVLRVLDPATPPAQAVGLTLVGTMLALAIVEHWLLVLPLDTTRLWRWAMRKRSRPGAHRAMRDTAESPLHKAAAVDEKLLQPR
jgi:putative photosynthetic complex assembly protein 2